MRTFDQLTQDERMRAVEHFVNVLIEFTACGQTSACFDEYQYVLDQLFVGTDDHKEILIDYLEGDRNMKVALLHQAGKTAKQAWYQDYGDLLVQPQIIDPD